VPIQSKPIVNRNSKLEIKITPINHNNTITPNNTSNNTNTDSNNNTDITPTPITSNNTDVNINNNTIDINNNIIDINNIFQDDELISLIKSNFNESDMELFELNYKIYTTNKNNLDDFIVDFGEVWSWIGFSSKGNAKKLLESKTSENKNVFEIDKDYITKKVFIHKDKNLGGRPSNKILLTVKCFKKFCLKASTDQADKIYDYYIKMEEIITKYIENKHKQIIEENNNNNKKVLELKNQEIISLRNKKYEEVIKDGHIYIFSTDVSNVYKCGRSNDPEIRRIALQTGNVNDIITYDAILTSNDKLLEKIVHKFLHKYRNKSGREHFECELKYIQLVSNITQAFFDTMNSSYQYITKEELLEKINNNILLQLNKRNL
jgi:hypothetical protein